MEDILNYFIKKSHLQKNEYFEYRQNSHKKTTKKSDEKKLTYDMFLSDIVIDNYVVFDLETTGFSPQKNRITEIGAVKIINNKIADSFNTLVNPGVFIPPFIEDKIKITNKMVENEPFIDEVFPKFLDFLEEYPLVAHNAGFDISFLNENAQRLNLKLKNKALDTLRLSKKAFPDLKSYSLKNLCEHFGIEITKAHRAYYDALAAYEIYKLIIKTL